MLFSSSPLPYLPSPWSSTSISSLRFYDLPNSVPHIQHRHSIVLSSLPFSYWVLILQSKGKAISFYLHRLLVCTSIWLFVCSLSSFKAFILLTPSIFIFPIHPFLSHRKNGALSLTLPVPIEIKKFFIIFLYPFVLLSFHITFHDPPDPSDQYASIRIFFIPTPSAFVTFR